MDQKKGGLKLIGTTPEIRITGRVLKQVLYFYLVRANHTSKLCFKEKKRADPSKSRIEGKLSYLNQDRTKNKKKKIRAIDDKQEMSNRTTQRRLRDIYGPFHA